MELRDDSQIVEEPTGVLCVSFRDGAPALRLFALDGKQWVMPWIHFLYACHEQSAELERIRLFYSSHEVLIEGVRLQPLIEHVSKFDVEWVKCFNKRYATLCPRELPFLERIVVEEKVDA